MKFVLSLLVLCLSTLAHGEMLQGYRAQRRLAESPSFLAVYVEGAKEILADSSAIQQLATELATRLSAGLGVPADSITVNSNLPFTMKTLPPNAQKAFPFTIKTADVDVKDSLTTPADYAKYAKLLENLLTNDANMKAPIPAGSGTVTVNSATFEVSMEAEKPAPSTVQLDEEEALVQEISGRSDVMQLRLKSKSIGDFLEDYEGIQTMTQSLVTSAATILSVPENAIYVYGIFDGSVVLQFTVAGKSASELVALGKRWSAAVSASDPSLVSAFDDFDSTFPGTTSTEKTTTTTTASTFTGSQAQETKPSDPSEEDSNAGMVAGAVLGSLAGVALIGGGAAGFVYKKRKDAAALTGTRPRDFGNDRSPGAQSPGGLQDVNIGEGVTPNVHNYR